MRVLTLLHTERGLASELRHNLLNNALPRSLPELSNTRDALVKENDNAYRFSAKASDYELV